MNTNSKKTNVINRYIDQKIWSRKIAKTATFKNKLFFSKKKKKNTWESRNSSEKFSVASSSQNVTCINVTSVLLKQDLISGYEYAPRKDFKTFYLTRIIPRRVTWVWPRNAYNRSVIFARKTSQSCSRQRWENIWWLQLKTTTEREVARLLPLSN